DSRSYGAWTDGYTDQDQSAAIGGFLAAATCWSPYSYDTIRWVGGNDAPYDSHSEFGLFSGFSGSAPIPRGAWDSRGDLLDQRIDRGDLEGLSLGDSPERARVNRGIAFPVIPVAGVRRPRLSSAS